ncbi:MAG: hypothetical protein QXO16_03605 [Archaeoglobaceae archaeon]
MKWETHKAIAQGIAKTLGLPRELERELLQGVVEPDIEREADEVHHDASRMNEVKKLVWMARKARLNCGDKGSSYSRTGFALHSRRLCARI